MAKESHIRSEKCSFACSMTVPGARLFDAYRAKEVRRAFERRHLAPLQLNRLNSHDNLIECIELSNQSSHSVPKNDILAACSCMRVYCASPSVLEIVNNGAEAPL